MNRDRALVPIDEGQTLIERHGVEEHQNSVLPEVRIRYIGRKIPIENSLLRQINGCSLLEVRSQMSCKSMIAQYANGAMPIRQASRAATLLVYPIHFT